MGLEYRGLGSVGVQIEEAVPRIGKYCCAVIAGNIPKKKGHGNGHGCGIDSPTSLFRTTEEVSRLGPRGSGMACGLVSAQFRIPIRKGCFERLCKADRFNSLAF